MRILSTYKDFYDFVITEPDNKKFFLRETKEVVFDEDDHKKNPDRTLLSPISKEKLRGLEKNYLLPIEKGYFSAIAFCDKLRAFFVYENVIYWHFEDIPESVIDPLIKKAKTKWGSYDSDSYERFRWYRDPLKDMLRYKKIDWILDRHTKEPIQTPLNKIFNSPIILINNANIKNLIVNPKLNLLGFNKVLTPTEAYQEIYNWIPYNEPDMPKSPDDMSRYEAKGFDKKTSFRPKMK